LGPFDRQLQEFNLYIQEFEQKFRELDAETTNGPHGDLSLQELRVIEYLGESNQRIMKDLAAYLMLAGNSVTSLVDNLENKGIVRRQRSTEDRRVIHVQLTLEGQKLFESAMHEKMTMLRLLLGALTPPERETFLQLFRKMTMIEQTTSKKD
jgi:MarR family transcriptional regulator, 2-MHQ and catechol-resistance regulon repressor